MTQPIFYKTAPRCSCGNPDPGWLHAADCPRLVAIVRKWCPSWLDPSGQRGVMRP